MATDTGTKHRLQALVRRLAETEEEIRRLLPAGVDAVLDPERRRPILLGEAQEALRASEARLRDLLGHIPALVVELGPGGELLFANRHAKTTLGLEGVDLEGQPFWSRVVAPPSVAADVEAAFLRGDVAELETRVQGPRGGLRVVLWTSRRRTGSRGDLERIYAFGQDITPVLRAELTERELDDERAARRLAEHERARSAFLAEASDLLSHIEDIDDAVARAADLAAGPLATFCVIHLRGPDGRVTSAHYAHADPGGRARLGERLRAQPLEEIPSHPVWRVLERGEPEIANAEDEASLVAACPDEAARRAIAGLGATSYLWVPMRTRGEVMGVVSLGRAGGPPFGPRDLDLALEFGHRTAMAVENARIFRTALDDARAKSAFLAEMSHELRTPLNAVIGIGELLLMDLVQPLSPEAKSHLRRIQTAGNHLTNVVNGILSFFRMEAGREVLEVEAVDLRSLVEDTADIMEPLAAEKALTLSCEGPGGHPKVAVDVGKVRQILINLLGNAVKYTDRGEVRLVAAVEREEIVFRVSDTGRGMTDEEVALIFEPFQRIGGRGTSPGDGAGLGLAVTRRLVDLMGGSIRVETAPGAGSEFIVRLPLRPDLAG